ncbi:hypothetical protein TRFO_07382 [Tritrichomonas foetus]|uniref:Protein kinase domain-containing protein n=1 Tax=Tritrichomonas foetus TaxID=1144522 RepID=A0A1J4JWB5_9EUKA|nr:hypothetical protein TRFO_07382 [Tritrichomonas foetus]|eukprot:OHT01820.1 hypothetical protein TRFO_07382 [Tritrichomonas foetus]
MSDGDFIQLQDSKVSVNLETLASVNFVAPAFRQLTDFSISTLIYHGYMSSIFHGKVENTPVIIEACSRIPYRLVCREIKLLNDLNINNIVKIAALTRNSSLGIICLAYKLFDFQPWTEIVPQKCLPNLLFSLLTVLSEIHANDIFHGWVCRSSVYVNPDFKSIILGSFHAAAKIGDPAPLIPDHPCAPPKISEEDRRPDDIYSAALWFHHFISRSPKNRWINWTHSGLSRRWSAFFRKW